MIRITATGSPLAEQADAIGRILAQATSIGVDGAIRGAVLDMRRALIASGGKFAVAANAIRGDSYPKLPRYSPQAAGEVHASGKSSERYLSAFATGPLITPRKGRALAIPLHNFRGFDRALIGPRSSFWGGKLIFIPAKPGAALGRIGILASRADAYSVGRGHSRNSASRRAASKDIAKEFIPQFLLVAAVRLPKLFDPDSIMENWAAKLPDLIDQAADLLER